MLGSVFSRRTNTRDNRQYDEARGGCVLGDFRPRYALVSSKEDQSKSFPTDVSQGCPPKEAESVAACAAGSTRQASPEVAAFIERVVVPALVKRYIAQLSSTGERGE
jgi:hypothetical protein